MKDNFTYRHDEPALMLFDGICVFCSTSVRFIMQRTDRKQLVFVPMQTGEGQTLLKKLAMPLTDFETLVVIYEGNVLVKSAAVKFLLSRMSFPWPVIAKTSAVVPEKLLDMLYLVVARNRYQIFGKTQVCYLPGINR